MIVAKTEISKKVKGFLDGTLDRGNILYMLKNQIHMGNFLTFIDDVINEQKSNSNTEQNVRINKGDSLIGNEVNIVEFWKKIGEIYEKSQEFRNKLNGEQLRLPSYIQAIEKVKCNSDEDKLDLQKLKIELKAKKIPLKNSPSNKLDENRGKIPLKNSPSNKLAEGSNKPIQTSIFSPIIKLWNNIKEALSFRNLFSSEPKKLAKNREQKDNKLAENNKIEEKDKDNDNDYVKKPILNTPSSKNFNSTKVNKPKDNEFEFYPDRSLSYNEKLNEEFDDISNEEENEVKNSSTQKNSKYLK